MSNTKNDKAWSQLFEKYGILHHILNNETIEISSTQINEFREARLMTKFDHRSQLPSLFADNNLSILPNSRGSYIIGQFETFCDFAPANEDLIEVDFPHFLESLNHKEISSEATAINCSYVTNILKDFIGEENLLPTVSGRMGSSKFSFDINIPNGSYKIQVDNSQIEIDGGFESETSLSLIEAKNYPSKDFLIRQLYYPFRLWSEKISKKVRPIFLSYTNGIFHLREFAFSQVENYNSIRLIKQKKYTIQNGKINTEIIEEILGKIRFVEEPNIPFPQADSFERIINLCELISQNSFLTKDQLTFDYDFNKDRIDPRQIDYYTNAARYLGLVEKGSDPVSKQVIYFLSKQGEKVMGTPLFERQKSFIKMIASHKVFSQTLKRYLAEGEIPTKEKIVDLMRRSNLYNVNSEITFFRRASTISGWINWIIQQIEE